MHNIKQWGELSKGLMSELDYLRHENKLLKENLEELEKREIINHENELIIRRKPTWPGCISAYIIAFFIAGNGYELKNQLIGSSFILRFFMWLGTFYACLVVFWLLYVVFDLFILEKLDKISGNGFYKKDNEFHFKSLIPHIIFFLIILLLTVLGPQ